MYHRNVRSCLLLGVAAAGLASAPAFAQESKEDTGATDIIVTAQRVEQRLQDVPISITVFNEQQLQNRNVAVATDLAAYTPSLSVNQRYGPEKASFSIRGFNQDQATAPTVGVYFADVVGVRSQGGTTSGNTVGAGSFTDLQNVQVLKGPQGTLFGRNTTGGAVLLVPQKPTDKLEGYVQGTYGNYDQKRVEAALNLPLADTFKIRFSVDRNKRDGYMINHSGFGPSAYNDVDYEYYRFSVVANITPDLENYTVFHYSNSHSNGYAARLFASNPSASPAVGAPGSAPDPRTGINPTANLQYYILSNAARDQINRQAAAGDGPLDVEVDNPDPFLNLRTWQVINTTTWQASDHITVKNIASYGEFTEHTSFSLNSDNFFVPNNPVTQSLVPRGIRPGAPIQYILLDLSPGEANSDESTFTEELQLQGHSEKLDWVAGGYLELSRPLGWSAGRTGIYGYCTDTEHLICQQPIGFGVISASRTKLSFNDEGLFAQATYKFSDKLSLTGGFRYTFDKITGYSEGYRLTLLPGGIQLFACNDPRAGNGVVPTTISNCRVGTGTTFTGGIGAGQSIGSPKSDKPTWLINVEYHADRDVMLYAKYARGYRQGGLNFTNPGLETWQPEKVDAYEGGAKLTLRGAVSGYVNVAAFYNNFSNQQIFASLIGKPTSGIAGGAAIINAGRSKIYGVELDSSVSFLEYFRIDAGYTYLRTKIEALAAPTLDPNSPFSSIIPSGSPGDPLAFSPRNKLAVTGTVMLPVPDHIGKMAVSATYLYTSKQIQTTGERDLAAAITTATGSYFADPGVIQPTNLVNLNFNWDNVAGSPIDLSVFATNVTNKDYRVAIGQSLNTAGFENALYGPPRMYGVRLRYTFGR